ncbi:hypothetical protein GCM10022398_20860 [Acetobacter lovaniensis]
MCGQVWDFARLPVWRVCRMGSGSLGQDCGGSGKGLSRAQPRYNGGYLLLVIFRTGVCRVNGCK